MKRITLLFGALFLMMACQKVEEIIGPEIDSGSTKIVNISATDPNIGIKPAMVYLPPNYDSTKQYPMVIFLHGFGSDHLFWQSVEDIKGILDYLISANKIKPCIALMPNAKNALSGSFYSNSEYSGFSVFGKYEDYIIADVVNYLKSNYPVDTAEIYLVGLSMGAYGALKLAVKHPDIFKGCASHSGPIAFERFLDTIPGTNVNMIKAVLSEWADFSYRIPGNAGQYLGPSRPLSTMLFAMAGAFSPKVAPLSAFDTLNYEIPLQDIGGGLWAGVRLPLKLTGDTNSVFREWLLNHDVFNLITSNYLNISQKKLKIYIDCGLKDELFLQPHAIAVHNLLNHFNYPHYYELFENAPGYPATQYPPRHVNYLQIRLEKSLTYLLGK
ncbi:MAG: alpha/beta hydrolase-fold protein [candidate division WOR-3 bacterium]